MSAETEISNVGMVPNSALEDMSTTDESMSANQDDQPETTWEAPRPAIMASCSITNSKPSQPEKIPLKIPGNVLTTTSVASAAAAAALASAAADAAAAAAAAAANKNNPNSNCKSIPMSMTIPTNPNHINSNTNGIVDKPYKCDTCEKAFALRRALKAHKRVHTDEKPFKCDTCPKAFNHQGALKAHKRVHTGEKPFKCDVCDMCFSHRSTLITHRRTHTGEKPFKCDLCDDVFSYRQTMKSHRKKHLATANANVPNATGMVMTSTASSTLGIASAAKRQLFKCINCGKDCTSREELDAHIEMHLEKNPFRCFTCNKTFSNCDTLEKHKLTHLIPQAAKSGSVLTATNAGLTERIVGANKDMNGDLSVPHFSSVSSQQQAQQQQQQQQQPQQHHLHHQQQQLQHQLPKKKANNNNNNNNTTNNNNNNSSSSTLGTNRIHIEERPYKCCICNEGFPTITALTNHERTHNDDTSMSVLSSSLLSSYTCDICGVVFSEKSNLDAHKKMHVHEKPFDYKPITVASQKDYSDSPFECTICGALFTNNMWSSSA